MRIGFVIDADGYALRVRSRIEKVLDWAKVHGYREGENPAKWRGNLATEGERDVQFNLRLYKRMQLPKRLRISGDSSPN